MDPLLEARSLLKVIQNKNQQDEIAAAIAAAIAAEKTAAIAAALAAAIAAAMLRWAILLGPRG